MIFRNESGILELDDDSTDVFKRNIFDRYMDIPDSMLANGTYSCIYKTYFLKKF